MPKTGDKCTETGKYASDCGSLWTVQMHRVGDQFPPCPHCRKPVNYSYVGPK